MVGIQGFRGCSQRTSHEITGLRIFDDKSSSVAMENLQFLLHMQMQFLLEHGNMCNVSYYLSITGEDVKTS